MTKEKAQENLNKMFERYFEQLVKFGFNPELGSYTVSGFLSEGYKKYAKNRIRRIKDGIDKVYKISKEIKYMITKK